MFLLSPILRCGLHVFHRETREVGDDPPAAVEADKMKRRKM
jgi:hypothetical protein